MKIASCVFGPVLTACPIFPVRFMMKGVRSMSLRKNIRILLPVLLAAAAAGLLCAYYLGLFHIVARVPSPNGAMTATVFDRDYTERGGGKVPAATVTFNGHLRGSGTSYTNTTYVGLWWAPDSTKYIIQLAPVNSHGVAMVLTDLEGNVDVNMGIPVRISMRTSPLADYGFQMDERGMPAADLDFVQWSADSDAIQFRYSFTDTAGADHSGTFWFSLEACRDGAFCEDGIRDIHEET